MTNIEFAKLENDEISFVFTINPSKAVVTTGQKQAKITIPGRDGDLIQFMGQANKSTTISGTLYSGTQYHRKKKISLEELVRILQKISNTPTAFDFAGILTNQAKAEKVTVSNFTITRDAKNPKSFSYSMILTEWRAFNTPSINLVRVGEENFAEKLTETFKKHRLR